MEQPTTIDYGNKFLYILAILAMYNGAYWQLIAGGGGGDMKLFTMLVKPFFLLLLIFLDVTFNMDIFVTFKKKTHIISGLGVYYQSLHLYVMCVYNKIPFFIRKHLLFFMKI